MQFYIQTNELTGLFFLAAVFVASPIAAAYVLVAAFIAPAGGLIMRDRDNAEEADLPLLDPLLMTVSLPASFWWAGNLSDSTCAAESCTRSTIVSCVVGAPRSA